MREQLITFETSLITEDKEFDECFKLAFNKCMFEKHNFNNSLALQKR